MLHWTRRSTVGKGVRIAPLARVRDSHLEDGVRIGSGCVIAQARIGRRSYIGHNATVMAAAIGRFSSIAWNTTIIGLGSHPTDRLTTHPWPYLSAHGLTGHDDDAVERRPTSVGHDCWIGVGASVLAGATLGNGCIVAAGAVVTGPIDDYSIVGGIPARFLRYRFDERTRAFIAALAWWDWPDAQLRRVLPLFREPISDLSRLCALLAQHGIEAHDSR
jgi:acetyltransferase-like isoleucine patch superfamily enzyme